MLILYDPAVLGLSWVGLVELVQPRQLEDLLREEEASDEEGLR